MTGPTFLDIGFPGSDLPGKVRPLIKNERRNPEIVLPKSLESRESKASNSKEAIPLTEWKVAIENKSCNTFP